MSKLNSIPETITQLKAGKMIIVVDDEKRENEGDLMIAAEKATPETINFMTKYARGLVCLVIAEELAKKLKLYPMTEENTSKYGCNFTISVDAKENTTTGISAYDRAETIKKIIDSKTKPEDLVHPGHIFPLVADPQGVLKRLGHTEAALDLVKLAGLYPAMVLCEILAEDGKMAKLSKLLEMAKKFDSIIVFSPSAFSVAAASLRIIKCLRVLPFIINQLKTLFPVPANPFHNPIASIC